MLPSSYYHFSFLQILANIWGVHNDPAIWESPQEFRPERHLNSSGEFVHSNHVIPFSLGPRRCLGEQLAMMEIFFILVSMVQKFQFLPDPDASELPDIESGTPSILFTPKNFCLVAKER